MPSVEREARYTISGLTGLERDRLIVTLRAKGWSQAKIGKYVGVTQQAVCYTLARESGKKRVSTRLEPCDGCGNRFPSKELEYGMCAQCEAEL